MSHRRPQSSQRFCFLMMFFAAGAVLSWQRPVQADSDLHGSRLIRLTRRQIDPQLTRTLIDFPAPPGRDEPLYFIVQSSGQVDDAFHELVGRRGARVVAYIPDDALLVQMNEKSFRSMKGDAGVSWIGRLQPADKLSVSLEGIGSDLHGPVVSRLLVQIMDGEEPQPWCDRINELFPGSLARVHKSKGFFRRILMSAPAVDAEFRARKIAELEGVAFVEPAGTFDFFNQAGRWVGQNFLSNGTIGDITPIYTKGITGVGQITGIGDDGFDYDHNCFRDATQPTPGPVKNSLHRKVVSLYKDDPAQTGKYTSGHGTHTAGSIACDINGNGIWDCNNVTCLDSTTLATAADGMAPGAKLAVSWLGTTDPPGVPPDLNDTFFQTYRDGAKIHSNSWGSCTGCNTYTSHSQDIDEFTWNHSDMLILFAAGNAGPGANTVGPPSTAKNCVTVGSALRGTAATGLSGFSSMGPTADGRRKPTVTATGSSVQSALAAASSTAHGGSTTMSGTSMATPTASGYATLVRSYLIDGWYPTGTKVPANSMTSPSGALLKAMLISSAANMPTPAVRPSNEQGWGRVNLTDTLYFSGATNKLFIDDHKNGLTAGSGNATYTFNVTNNSVPLKVVLCWTDPPPAIMTGVNLVNDLDLTVTGPGGAPIFKGSVFASGASVAGGAYDRLNVEEVVLTPASPALGNWTVQIAPFNIPRGPQPYALVVTGGFAPPVQLGISRISNSDGNNNIPEAGEAILMTPVLADLSGAGATGISATLSTSTAGITVTGAGPIAYGNVAGGGVTSPASAFGYSIGAGVPCGTYINFLLTVTTAGGNLTIPFKQRVGKVSVTETTLVSDAFAGTAGNPPSAAVWTVGVELAATGWTTRVVLDNSIETSGTAPAPISAPNACYIGISGAGASRPAPYLQTATLNFAGSDRGHVDFYYWISKSTQSDFLLLKASTDGGTSWRELWRNIQHDNPFGLDMNKDIAPRTFQKVSIDLAGTGILGGSNVKFRWTADFDAAEATKAAYIDDVGIFGDVTVCNHPDLTLYVTKSGGKAHLSWAAGTSPYLVTRFDNYFHNGGIEAAPPLTAVVFDEDVLGDGSLWAWSVD